MKIRLAVFVFLAGLMSAGLYAQNINNGRRYIKNAKLAFGKDKMNPRIRSSIERAFKEDKNNPETYFLISLYFFNLDVDHQKAKTAFGTFKKKMSKLAALNGGKYGAEFHHLQIYRDKKTLTRQELGDELYNKAWIAINQEDPKELCLQSANRIRSFLTSENLVQIKEELNILKSNCVKTDETLKQTMRFLEAYYELLNNNLNTSFQLNTSINAVRDEYKSLYAEFENKLKIKINEKSTQTLTSSNRNIDTGKLAEAQRKLNGIIQYMPLLNPASKSEYHYQYALLYKKNNNWNKAIEEIKKADKINYKPNEDKIVKLMTQISTFSAGNRKNENTPLNSPEENKLINPPVLSFIETAQKVKRLIEIGSTSKAMEILNSFSNPETLSKNDRVSFLFLKTKIDIMEKRFDRAANNILDLERINTNTSKLKSIKNDFNKGITAILRNDGFKLTRKHIDQFEFAIKNNLLLPAYAGLVSYTLAKSYKGNNRNRFNYYKKKAKDNRYSSQKLAALNWDAGPAKDPETFDDKSIHWDMPSVNAIPFVLTVQSDESKGLYITEKRRYFFNGPLVANGISRAKITNSSFSLKSATGYEIELENFARKGEKEIRGDWYLALILTSVLGSLVFIR